MLCPEVLNFKAPESTFEVRRGTKEICYNKISNFNFSHLVSVILPDTLSIPKSISDGLLVDCEYYRVNKLTLSEIVSIDFINNFVKSGVLNLLSINRRIDCDDVIAITSLGKLVLNLNKITFQSLGLEGKVSHFHQKTKAKYVVTVNLLDPWEAGKPGHERLKTCLERLKNFDVIVTWKPPTKSVCPSSLAKYFHDLGYETKLCNIDYYSHTAYSVNAPIYDFVNSSNEDTFDFIEWLGLVALNGDLENKSPGDYLSSYSIPEPFQYFGQVKCLQWKGFFSWSRIQNFLDLLSDYCKQAEKVWIACYVQGFSDAPVAWGNAEHHYYLNGDNSFTYIMNKDDCVVFTQKCSEKCYKR